MTTPEVGTILRSRYVLKEQLSKNATRQTWMAEDRDQNTTVVVKMLAFNLQLQWQEVKLFEREAQALQRLEHPRIPKYLDYFTIEGKPDWMTLVMSFVPGESLQAQVDRGVTFDEQRLRDIASDVLTVLTYLHDRQPPVLHRDIKPSNLIVGEGNQTNLVDFGAAQIQPTQVGTFTIVGTYGYTPMEQFGGRAVPASDLYSLGATLVHLATGIPPADLPQKEFRIDYRDRVRLSPEFMDCLDRLIEPGLGDRYFSGRETLQDLEDEQRNIKTSSSYENSITHKSTIPDAKSDRPKTLSPYRTAGSLELITRIKYHRTVSGLTIKFKEITFEAHLDSRLKSLQASIYNYPKERNKTRKAISNKRQYLTYAAIWLGSCCFLPVLIFAPSSLIVVILIAVAASLLIELRRYSNCAREITLSLDRNSFEVFRPDSREGSFVLSEKTSEINRVEFLGSQKQVSDEVYFDLVQIGVIRHDSSRRDIRIDTNLSPSELGWIQRVVNRDILRFRKSTPR